MHVGDIFIVTIIDIRVRMYARGATHDVIFPHDDCMTVVHMYTR